MGYSCSTAALRTLQAVKQVIGGHLKGSNEIAPVTRTGTIGNFTWVTRKGFFERGREQADGAITGTVYFDDGGKTNFRINADGTVAKFPGLFAKQNLEVSRLVRDPNFRSNVAVI